MAKKIKKVSVNQIDEVLDSVDRSVNIDWCGIDVEVHKFISLQDMIQFVYDAVDACFMEDGAYVPEVKWLAYSCAIVEHFTNIRLPENIDKKIALIYGTNIVGEVTNVVSQIQLQALTDAIDEKISHMLDLDVQHTRYALNSAVEKFADAQEDMQRVFGSLTKEDVQNFANAFSGGKIDEEKIVKAMTGHTEEE